MSEETGEYPHGGADELLAWPPPGLGRIQGDLWLVVHKLAAAGVVLVVPLLCVLTIPQSESGLGPLGDAWWVVVITTLAGVGLFAEAVVALVRLLNRVRRAASEGYTARVIGLVVADRARDGGFLLQGTRAFSSFSPEARTALARIRLLSGLAYLAATGWFVLVFGLLVVLATRGRVSPEALLVWTVVPAMLLGVGGLVLRAAEASLVRRARREWHRLALAEGLVRQEVDAWKALAGEHGIETGGRTVNPLVVRVATIAVIGVGFLSFVPAVALVPASSMGTIVGGLAGSFSTTRSRVARAEAFRDQRLPADTVLDAVEAGRILNVLTWVGRSDESTFEGLLPPVREYEGEWFPPDPPSVWEGHFPPTWSDTVWIQADAGLGPEQVAYLREVAAHPAHEEFSRLARAASLDHLGGALEMPLEAGSTFFDLPIPRLSGLRYGADAHVAAAALHSVEGRHDEAVRMAREVISVGFLLVDDSPSLIGNLVGAVLVRVGGDALEHALRRSDDDAGLAALQAAVEAVDRATIPGRDARAAGVRGGQAVLAAGRAIALDSTQVRGLRWEYTHMNAVAMPCLNMRNIVFGPGPAYEEWLAEVRGGLVRTEAEAEYFDIAARGLDIEGTESRLLSRLLTVAMGGGAAPSSCARVIATLGTMM